MRWQVEAHLKHCPSCWEGCDCSDFWEFRGSPMAGAASAFTSEPGSNHCLGVGLNPCCGVRLNPGWVGSKACWVGPGVLAVLVSAMLAWLRWKASQADRSSKGRPSLRVW